ncbi:MAG: phosphoglycolate phosphatase [Betaproteobacteria bacterium]|nr:phosphoglycolate phosphatase [Betaproteobacteria bacterium]
MIQAVLFDLDGTFADTAPDLAYALNRMRAARGLPPLPTEATRPVASMGARGLLGVGFNIVPDHPEYAAMREEFLGLYEQNLCRHTRLFPGMPELLDAVEARGLRWGIVTNKAERFTRPLLDLLQVGKRAACVIGGDTTPHIKPHPAPLLAASRTLALAPERCAYVGDDRRDVEAGRAAGMKTVAVTYGYLNGGIPQDWGADAVIQRPQDLLAHL